MILATGVDIVKVQRFAHWAEYSDAALAKVFHPSEITRFRDLWSDNPSKALQFLASRFAVKEAFFKAFCDFYRAAGTARPTIPFLLLARSIFLEKTADGAPVVPSAVFLVFFPASSVRTSVSIAHESCCVVSSIVLWAI